MLLLRDSQSGSHNESPCQYFCPREVNKLHHNAAYPHLQGHLLTASVSLLMVIMTAWQQHVDLHL